jgi:hypothetical protein
VSEIEVLLTLGFIAIATGFSYHLGHKTGILDAVEGLERLGIIEFDESSEK